MCIHKDVKEEASQMIISFKKECEEKVNNGRYYPKDLQIGKTACMRKV